MTSRKKQQKNRRDSIKDWRFNIIPERSLRQFTTPVNPVLRLLPFRVAYGLFNVEQCEGIVAPNAERVVNPIEECKRIVRQMPNPPAMEQDGRAWYRPSTDTVGMPARIAFYSAEEFYSTLFHELTHSTGHPKRVGREAIEKLNTFGSLNSQAQFALAEHAFAIVFTRFIYYIVSEGVLRVAADVPVAFDGKALSSNNSVTTLLTVRGNRRAYSRSFGGERNCKLSSSRGVGRPSCRVR